jgi:hypothetical protein
MLNVAMLNAVVLNVAAPRPQLENVSGKKACHHFQKNVKLPFYFKFKWTSGYNIMGIVIALLYVK